jgi:metal-responsive CopG/Arc/MetJ family transcriptional regulator
MIKKVMISIDKNVLNDFDKITGLVPRSAYIANLMKKEVDRVGEIGE